MSKWQKVEHRDPIIQGHSLSLLLQEQKMNCSNCGGREYMILKANGELRADCVKCRFTAGNIEIRMKT